MNAATKAPSIKEVKRKTRWIVSSRAAKTIDDLSFTSRDEKNHINWWDVTPPKTDYYHVHQYLGRAYAFEVLDLLHNPEAKDVDWHTLGFILKAIARSHKFAEFGNASVIAEGFFEGISEFVSTGTANR